MMCLVFIQVNGKAIKSPPLLVDTSDAIAMKPDTPPSEKVSATALPPSSSSSSYFSKNEALLLHDVVVNDDDDDVDDDVIINKKHTNINTIEIMDNISKEKNILYYNNSNNNYRSAWLLNIYENMKEIILGICTALIVFLFILTMFCAYRGKKFNYYMSKDAALLENDDISVHCES